MSHSGCVIHPSRSPGLIRVFTTGFILREQGELLFIAPGRCKDNIEDQIKQRFIPFFLPEEEDRTSKGRKKKRMKKHCMNPPAGDMVLFDIEKFDPGCFPAHQWNELKTHIPKFWISQWCASTGKSTEDFMDDFKFAYMARMVRRLPNRHFLTKIFDFWDGFDGETVECLLESQNCARYGLKKPIKINHKDLDAGDDRRVSSFRWYYPTNCIGEAINPNEITQPNDRITDVVLNLDADLVENGVHMMPDDDELPLEDPS